MNQAWQALGGWELWKTDTEGTVVDWHDKTEEAIGLDTGAGVGQAYSDFLNEEVRATMYLLFRSNCPA